MINDKIAIPENSDDLLEKAKKIFDFLDVNETTKNDYKMRIEVFINFIKASGINNDSFLNFKKFLREKVDWSVSTKNKYLATARVFLKELHKRGYLPVDITQNIKTFNQVKKHKKIGLTEEEVKKVLNFIRTLPDSQKNLRLKTIFSLLIFQGLRQIEIARLKINDIDFTNKIIYVQGKGQDDTEPVPIHPETLKYLKKYLQTNKIENGYIFVCRSNNHKNYPLTTRSIRGFVKSVFKYLNINKTTHGFRHYFVTKLLREYQGNIIEVAKYTRHKSLEMLQVYNDDIRRFDDLPRFYKSFSSIL